MNKIYKVIWSKARNCYVVVSEIAKTHSKGGTGISGVVRKAGSSALLTAAVTAMLMAPLGTAWADSIPTQNYDPANKQLEIGDEGVSTGGRNSVAVGIGAQTSDSNTVAVGTDVVASGKGSVAIGNSGTTASGSGSVAIGQNVSATEGGTVAIGQNADASAAGAAAVGQDATASEEGSAFGQKATATGREATAIGSGAKALQDGDASLGEEATADGGNAVAAGNSAQATAGNAAAYGASSEASATDSTALGSNSKATADDALAAGSGARATAEKAVAVGGGNEEDAAFATAEDAIAIGSGSRSTAESAVAIGGGGDKQGAVADGKDAVALGTGTHAGSDRGVAIGGGNEGEGAATSGNAAIAIGSSSGDGKLGAIAAGDTSIVLGSEASSSEDAVDGVAIGTGSAVNAAGGAAFGAGSSVAEGADNGAALGPNSSVTVANGVALGAGSVADTEKEIDGYVPNPQKVTDPTTPTWKSTEAAVSIGDPANGITRQITGVAAGTEDTDAANIAQLKAAMTHYYSVKDNRVIQDNYNNDGATGNNALAAGVSTTATGDYATAMGPYAAANGNASIAIGSAKVDATGALTTKQVAVLDDDGNPVLDDDGNPTYETVTVTDTNPQATGLNGIAIGTNAKSWSDNATVMGTDASSWGTNGTAVGTQTQAGGENSSAYGFSAHAYGNDSTALGENAYTDGNAVRGTAVGDRAKSMTTEATAVGSQSYASGPQATAVGNTAVASNTQASAVGYHANALGSQGTAVGEAVVDYSAQYGTAVGYHANAKNTYATAVTGIASGYESTAVGKYATAGTTGSTAVGPAEVIGGTYGTAVGKSSTVHYGDYGTAIGGGQTSNSYTTAVGYGSSANYDNATAVGRGANGFATNTTAVGYGATATYDSATAVGRASNAFSYSSTAVGLQASSRNSQSTAVGFASTADGTNSTSVGSDAYSYGTDSTAIGRQSTAYGQESTAIGGADTPYSGYQAVSIGKSAVGNSSQATAVGAGAQAQSSQATAVGYNADAKSDSSTAVGKQAQAQSSNATSVGNASNAGAYNSTAVGYYAQATGSDATAVGEAADAYSYQATAVGYQAQANNSQSTAVGIQSHAGGSGSTAVGQLSQGNSNYGTAVGYGAVNNYSASYGTSVGYQAQTSYNSYATAVGAQSVAYGSESTAVGKYANTGGSQSVAIGPATTSNSASNSVAIGNSASAQASQSTAIGGAITTYNGYQGVAIGKSAVSDANYAAAVGSGAQADRNYSTAVGYGAHTFYNDYTTAVGYEAQSSGYSATAVGNTANANSSSATAVGDHAQALNSSATGVGNYAKGGNYNATGVGYNASASGQYSTATGNYASASNTNSTATGSYANASGSNATATGYYANAWGSNSVAAGYYANAGNSSVAMGQNATAWGTNAIALGTSSNAGNDAVVLGRNAVGWKDDTIVLGMNSVSGEDKQQGTDIHGYDPLEDAGGEAIDYTTPTWQSTNNAVSFGRAEVKDEDGNVTVTQITRQINNVAAGTLDTDAVNVAQLKRAIGQVEAGSGMHYYGADDSENPVKDDAGNITTPDSNITRIHNQQLNIIGDSEYGNVTTTKYMYDGVEYFKQDDGSYLDADRNPIADGVTPTEESVTSLEKTKDGNILTSRTEDKNGIQSIQVRLNDTIELGGPGKDGADGKDGFIGVNGADGISGVGIDGKDGITVYGKDGKDGDPAVAINGKDGVGTIGLSGRDGTNGKDGTSLVDIQVGPGTPGLDGKDGTTRIIYEDGDGEHEVATLDDGLRFAADDGLTNAGVETENVIPKKLNNRLDIVGDAEYEYTYGESKYMYNGVEYSKNADDKWEDAEGNVLADGIDPEEVKSVTNATETKAGNIITSKGTAKDGSDAIMISLSDRIELGGPGKDGADGVDGFVGVNGKDGISGVGIDGTNGITVYGKDGKDGDPAVAINGKDGVGTIGLSGRDGTNGKDGTSLVDIQVGPGTPGLDGKDGTTRIIYEDGDGEHEVATLDDGLKYSGDFGSTKEDPLAVKLNKNVDVVGNSTAASADDLTDGNIGVVAEYERDEEGNQTGDAKLTVKLNKDINLGTDGSLTVGGEVDEEGNPKTDEYGNPTSIVIGPQTVNHINGDTEQGDFIVGLDNINWDPTNIVSGRAATEDQLAAVQTHYYSVNDNGVQQDNWLNDGATGVNALAAGTNTTAKGANATAIGNGAAAAEDNTVAAGNSAAANGLNSVAIGNGATATAANGIALGAYSMADRMAATEAGYDVSTGTNYARDDAGSATWTATAGALSIGGTNEYKIEVPAGTPGATAGEDGKYYMVVQQDTTRQITGVAAGLNDTDAVNVAQLKRLENAMQIHDYSVNSINPGSDLNYDNKGATGDDAMAAGVSAVAEGKYATAVGNKAIARNDNSTAVGNLALASADNASAFGNDAQATKENATAIGSGAQATIENSAAIGSGAMTTEVVGTATFTTKTGKVLEFAGTEPVGTVSIGTEGNERTITNVAAGRISETSTDAINGSQLYAALDAMSDEHTTVSVGGVKATADGVPVEGGNLAMERTQDPDTGAYNYDLKLAKEIDVDAIVVNGKDGEAGAIGLRGEPGADGAPGEISYITVTKDGVPGVDGKDGVTRIVIDDKPVATLDDGLKYTGDFGDGAAVKLNNTVNVVGNAKNEADLVDGNIGVTADQDGDNGKLTVKLNKDINLGEDGSVTMGDTVINNDGLTINGGPSFTTNKIDVAGNKIINVAPGEDGTDAVNVDQLNASRTKVTAGKNISSVNEVEEDGRYTYTIDAYDTKVEAGTGITVTGGEADEQNVRTYSVALSADTQEKIDNALSSLTTAADGVTAQTLDKDNTEANFISGDNITLTPSEEGITIATKADVTFNTVTATTVEGDTVKAETIQLGDENNNTSITYDGDRIKYGDTYVATLDDGLKFGANAPEANSGNPVANKLNSTVNIKAADAVEGHTYSTKNLTTTVDQDEEGNTTILVKMDNDLETDTIVVNGKDGKDGTIGINGEDGVTSYITVTHDGVPGVDGKDGITRIVIDDKPVATLDDGLKYTGDFGDGAAVKLNNTVNVVGNAKNEADLVDGNIGVTADQDREDGKLTIKLNKDINLGEDGSVTMGDVHIHDGDEISFGGNVIHNVAPGVEDTDVVNVSQLKEFSAAAKTEVSVGDVRVAADNTPVTGGNLELKRTQDETDGHEIYDVRLAKDIDVDTIVVNGKDGKDGTIGINGEDGVTSYITVTHDGVPGVDGKDGITRIVIDDKPIATLDDGMKFGANAPEANSGNPVANKLNSTVNIKAADAVEGHTYSTKNLTTTVDQDEEGNTTILVKMDNDLTADTLVLNGKDGINGLPGEPGKMGMKGEDGEIKTITITSDGAPGVDGKDGETITRLIVDDKPVATLDDGLKYAGDFGDGAAVKLNNTVNVKGEAANEADLTTGNIGVVASQNANGKDADLIIKLNKDINLGEDGSVTVGDTVINNDGLTITNGGPEGDIVINGDNVSFGGNVIHNVAPGVEDTDVVNVSQLKEVEQLASAHSTVTVDGSAVGENVTEGNLLLTVSKNENGGDNFDLKLNDNIELGGPGKDGKDGKDGSIGVNGADGKSGVGIDGKDGITIYGKDGKDGDPAVSIKGEDGVGHIGLAGPAGKDGADGISDIHMIWGDPTVGNDGDPGKDGITRIEYKDPEGGDHTVATLDDGLKYAGDFGDGAAVKLNNTVNVKGEATNEADLTTGNIGVVASQNANGKDADLIIKLNKDINLGDNGSVTIGDTTVNNDGLTINEGPSVTKDGIDAGGKKITNVAPGEEDTDAVNVSQLKEFAGQTGDTINNINNRVNKLGDRIDKVGAGAAALAGLHPLDFDPDAKWDVAAGYGHYRGENAVAIGAFYRPSEDVMLNVASTVGNGDNMVSAGVSVKIGGANHVSNSRVALSKQVLEMRKEMEDMKSLMADSAFGRQLDLSKIQLFPDTPENHWAYDYVATLAGNGLLEGYPDGNFRGDRDLTRYEVAAILYRAMMNGAQLTQRALEEFAPELDRIRVDTLTRHSDGTPSIQRVRIIKERR